MMRIKMNDIYGTEISIQESCSGYFRLDFEGDSFIKKKHDKTGEEIPCCVSLNENSARVLQAALNEYFTED